MLDFVMLRSGAGSAVWLYTDGMDQAKWSARCLDAAHDRAVADA